MEGPGRLVSDSRGKESWRHSPTDTPRVFLDKRCISVNSEARGERHIWVRVNFDSLQWGELSDFSWPRKEPAAAREEFPHMKRKLGKKFIAVSCYLRRAHNNAQKSKGQIKLCRVQGTPHGNPKKRCRTFPASFCHSELAHPQSWWGWELRMTSWQWRHCRVRKEKRSWRGILVGNFTFCLLLGWTN